jgi:ergothioneine biosynthesis protein EgtB
MKLDRPVSGYTPDQLIASLVQVRDRLRALAGCLPAEGWLGPREPILNPPLWEIGHIIWFQERWCLRARADGSCSVSLIPGADALYDSSAVPHDTRWDLALLDPAALDRYADEVATAVAARLRNEFTPALAYMAELSLHHELMHIEAWWMAFQHLGYAPPTALALPDTLPLLATRLPFAEAEVTLGSDAHDGFIFDNEKWRHSLGIPAFDIDSSPVTEAAFAAFVDAGGYQHPDVWSKAGWAWRTASDANHPVYWRKTHDGWQVRRFAQWTPLHPGAPMLHVSCFEAEACATWLGRRLPSAAEWQHATGSAGFIWGDGWEWTRDAFAPYPGFEPDPYHDYSQPWFHTHQELRGGGPVTDARLKRPGFRNFYLPHRRDAFAGFRTAST